MRTIEKTSYEDYVHRCSEVVSCRADPHLGVWLVGLEELARYKMSGFLRDLLKSALVFTERGGDPKSLLQAVLVNSQIVPQHLEVSYSIIQDPNGYITKAEWYCRVPPLVFNFLEDRVRLTGKPRSNIVQEILERFVAEARLFAATRDLAFREGQAWNAVKIPPIIPDNPTNAAFTYNTGTFLTIQELLREYHTGNEEKT